MSSVLYDFCLPASGKSGSVGLLREVHGSPAPVDGPDDVVLFFFHYNGDGTTSEAAVWSRVRRAWAPWPGPSGGPVRLWSPGLREVLGRRFMTDEAVAETEAFFGGDPWEYVLAACVMGS